MAEKMEDREKDFSEETLALKIDKRIDAIEKKPLKNESIFLTTSFAVFSLVVIEIVFSPLLNWLYGVVMGKLAVYLAVLYGVILLFIGGFFFYVGLLLVWYRRQQPEK
jgi:uncharacterized membrane protein